MELISVVSIIISSSVVAAGVSGIFTSIQGEKENYLKYVTNERSHWRDSVRKVIRGLPTDDEEKVKTIVGKLELLLNPYGKLEENDQIFKDAHIWREIDRINEIMDDSSEDIGKEKDDALVCTSERSLADGAPRQKLLYETKRLKDMLVLLLKYDWERSKREVTSDKAKILSYILVLAAFISISWMQYRFIGVVDEYYYMSLIAYLLWPMVIGALRTMHEKSVKVIFTKVIIYLLEAILSVSILFHYITSDNWQESSFFGNAFPVIIFATSITLVIENVYRKDWKQEYVEAVEKMVKTDDQRFVEEDNA